MIKFTFNGRQFRANKEDTIATALLRNGIRIFDRSIKRRRPRGVSCFSGHCMSCLLEVNGVSDVITCRTQLRPGASVRSQLASPLPNFDIRAPVQSASFKIFGPELYYRLFTRPAWASELWMRFLARMAGRAKLADPDSQIKPLPFTEHKTDVLVVGGGVAGMAAAREIVQESSLRILLVERGAELGGEWRRWQAAGGVPEPFEPLTKPPPEVPASVQVLLGTTLLALYEDRSALAVSDTSTHRIRFDRVIIAAGCYPRVIAFPDSDAPLFIPAAGLIRALDETSWMPKSIVLLDIDGQGKTWQNVFAAKGITVHYHQVTKDDCLSGRVQGKSGRRQAKVRLPSGLTVTAEVISWSAGWYPRTELIRSAGGVAKFSEQQDCFLPVLENMSQAAPKTFTAGGAAGILGFHSAMTHGQIVGASIKSQLGQPNASTHTTSRGNGG